MSIGSYYAAWVVGGPWAWVEGVTWDPIFGLGGIIGGWSVLIAGVWFTCFDYGSLDALLGLGAGVLVGAG